MILLPRLFSLVPLLLGTTGACSVHGSGVPKAEPRTASTFEDVEVASFIDATIVVGKPASITVHCDENLLPYIRTEVRGSTLVIDTKGVPGLQPSGRCEVDVTLPKLVNLSVTGAGDAQVTGAADGLKRVSLSGSADVSFQEVKSDALSVSVSGAGNMRVDRLASKVLDVHVTGAGDVKAKGAVDRVQVTTSGAGDVDTRNVTAQDAEVVISGTGDVGVSAARSVDVRISGVGTATVKGNPPQRKVQVSGVGSVDFE